MGAKVEHCEVPTIFIAALKTQPSHLCERSPSQARHPHPDHGDADEGGPVLGGCGRRAHGQGSSVLLVTQTRGGLKKRLQVLDATVGGTLLWCVAGLPPDPVGLHLVSGLQSQCIAWMLGIKRRAGELGYENRTRTHRAARAQIRSHSQRWSTTWLRRYWDDMGHGARDCDLDFPPPSSLFVCYRDLQWWHTEQARPTGQRHGGRFFSANGHEALP